MPDNDRLANAVRAAVRQMSGGEAPARDTPDDRAYDPRDNTLLGWPQPEPTEPDPVEADAEEPEERLSTDGSELGNLIGRAGADWAAAGWGPRTPVAAEDLEQTEGEDDSAASFTSRVEANADTIKAEFGMSPREYIERWSRADPQDWSDTGMPADAQPVAAEQYVAGVLEAAETREEAAAWLRWASSCPAEEWREAARSAGWPEAARPGFTDLPSWARTASLQAAIDDEVIRVHEGGARRL